jgi:hypothetical protein
MFNLGNNETPEGRPLSSTKTFLHLGSAFGKVRGITGLSALLALGLVASVLPACSAKAKKNRTNSSNDGAAQNLTGGITSQGSFLVGTNWKYCSYVYSTKLPTGDAYIFELTKITFTSNNDIKMVGEAYTSDEQCTKKLSTEDVGKIAGIDYTPDYFRFSNQSFKYKVAAEGNPSGAYDFDVTDDSGYELYTEIRLKDNQFQLGYACLTEDNIKAGDCAAIDGDSPTRRARNFKTEELVISWNKWD